MLSLIAKPKEVARSEQNIRKIAYLYGHSDWISDVAGRRLHDPRCTQSPHGRDLPRAYYVRVHYTTDEEAHVHVDEIWVSFDSGDPKHWSCFYDPGHGRTGYVLSPTGRFTFFFLDRSSDVWHPLLEYEEKLYLARLAKKGPEALPEIEEEDDLTAAEARRLAEIDRIARQERAEN